MKKLSVCLALLVLLGAAACDSADDTPSEAAESIAPEIEETPTPSDVEEEEAEDEETDDEGSESEGEETTVDRILGSNVDDHGIATVWEKSPDKPLEFEVDDYYFEPTVIFGQYQRGILLEVHNEGEDRHSLTIPTLRINEVIGPGETTTIGVYFPAVGQRHPFFCRFHQDQGMQGVLLAVQDRDAYMEAYKKGGGSKSDDDASSSDDY